MLIHSSTQPTPFIHEYMHARIHTCIHTYMPLSERIPDPCSVYHIHYQAARTKRKKTRALPSQGPRPEPPLQPHIINVNKKGGGKSRTALSYPSAKDMPCIFLPRISFAYYYCPHVAHIVWASYRVVFSKSASHPSRRHCCFVHNLYIYACIYAYMHTFSVQAKRERKKMLPNCHV